MTPGIHMPESALALSTEPAGTLPLPLISRNLAAFASPSMYPARYANDSDYTTEWRSRSVPATLTYNLSRVPAEQRQKILLVWYNGTYGYDHTRGCRGPGYNNPGAYSIEINHSPNQVTPPATGWIPVVQVRNNTLHSRQHILALGGAHWLRLKATASDGSPENSDIALNMDVYDASKGVDDSWIFYGDSITAAAMSQQAVGEHQEGNFAEQVFRQTGRFLPQENGGIPCISTADALPEFSDWLALFPGRYVAISLGSNDAGKTTPRQFYANYQAMVEQTLKANKVPVIPTIPWSPDPERQRNTRALNLQLERLYAQYPAIKRGPDFWTFFQQHPELISTDLLHPTEQGYGSYCKLWATTIAEMVYNS